MNLELARKLIRLSLAIYPSSDGQPLKSKFEEIGFTLVTACDCGGSEVAIADGFGVRAVVFAGTSVQDRPSLLDFKRNLQIFPRLLSEGAIAHSGYYEGARVGFENISHHLTDGSPLPLVFTGHSMGGALATIMARFFLATTVYSFGAPKVGNSLFWASLAATVYRVVHRHDIAPCLPPLIPWLTQGGQLWHIDDGKISHKKSRFDLLAFTLWGWLDHHPEAYVAALEGIQGEPETATTPPPHDSSDH